MEVNYLAIIVAGVVAMIIGAIWYSPGVFGKSWMKLTGMSTKDMDAMKKAGGMWKYYLAGLLSQLVMAYVLYMLFAMTGVAEMGEALKMAFWLWLGFIATVSLGSVLWERRPLKLYILNNAYNLVAILAMAAALMYMA